MTTPDLRWWPAGGSAISPSEAADEALTAHAYAVRGPGAVQVGRLCPVCGSSAHGRPWLRHDGVSVEVSLARSGPHLVTVLADSAVGVDVESVVAVARDWRPELVLAPGEALDLGEGPEVAGVWVAKEAILKYLGTGLVTPMTQVPLAAYAVRALPAPHGYRAAVCTGEAGSGRA